MAIVGDEAGNVGTAVHTVVVVPVTSCTNTYSVAGCLLTNVYAADGHNITRSYTWDYRYRLTAAASNGVTLETYQYDALNRMSSVTRDGVTRYLVYDAFM